LSRKRWLPSFVLLVMTVITIVAPSLLDFLPLPQYEFRPMDIERESVSAPTLPYGKYNFGNYIVVKSNTITSGSHVQGNVTFYWMGEYGWVQPPHVRILKESDYIRGHPEDLAKLTAQLANFTEIGPCCADPTYGRGYSIGFDFTSEETTSYYFLFDTSFYKITVVIFPSERVAPLWKEPLVWAVATAAVTVFAVLYREEPWHV